MRTLDGAHAMPRSGLRRRPIPIIRTPSRTWSQSSAVFSTLLERVTDHRSASRWSSVAHAARETRPRKVQPVPRRERGMRGMGLFTIEFELGRETRAMVERVAAETRAMIERLVTTAATQIELGPKTRETIEAVGMAPRGGKTRNAFEGLLRQRNEARRRE
jgi:hypothetical protein